MSQWSEYLSDVGNRARLNRLAYAFQLPKEKGLALLKCPTYQAKATAEGEIQGIESIVGTVLSDETKDFIRSKYIPSDSWKTPVVLAYLNEFPDRLYGDVDFVDIFLANKSMDNIFQAVHTVNTEYYMAATRGLMLVLGTNMQDFADDLRRALIMLYGEEKVDFILGAMGVDALERMSVSTSKTLAEAFINNTVVLRHFYVENTFYSQSDILERIKSDLQNNPQVQTVADYIALISA